jgi:hypothetical protein
MPRLICTVDLIRKEADGGAVATSAFTITEINGFLESSFDTKMERKKLLTAGQETLHSECTL